MLSSSLPPAVLFITFIGQIFSQITRHHPTDLFLLRGEKTCKEDYCIGQSSGTAGIIRGMDNKLGNSHSNGCICQCHSHLPAYRDDLNICVDDIHDCPLVPFISGTTYFKIPYVYLPLKGQIVYPSAEITFISVKSPICVVSGAKYLTKGGWVNLKNKTEAPFRLYRDEGRTFLQWLGESDLRLSMEGRLILVNLMCKDISDGNSNIFTPCVSFRVAGSPSNEGVNSLPPGMREWWFSNDEEETAPETGTTSGVIIAIFCILMAVIYAASILFYLQSRRRKRNSKSAGPLPEEGIVKNNPLLRHCRGERVSYLVETPPPPASFSDSDECSDAPAASENSCNISHSKHITSAIIHPCNEIESLQKISLETTQLSELNSIEKLPEENVSIIETLDNRDECSESVRSMAFASTRRKLYFNPSYFEPELLLAPPPGAVEFLTKIREVISIAKAKMESKKFFPSLVGIPEEPEINILSASVIGQLSVQNQNTSDIVENSIFKLDSLPSCHNCFNMNESKQHIIQKWLENVPIVKQKKNLKQSAKIKPVLEFLRQPTMKFHLPKSQTKAVSLPDINKQVETGIFKTHSNNLIKANSLTAHSDEQVVEPITNTLNDRVYRREVIQRFRQKCLPPPPPPSITSTTSSKENRPSNISSSPKVAKQLMDAVIKEFGHERSQDNLQKQQVFPKTDCIYSSFLYEFEVDSLERITKSNTNKEPEWFYKNSNNSDKSILSTNLNNNVQKEEHDYEIILMNSDVGKSSSLPNIFCKPEYISEVYVNSGYYYSSSESTSQNSDNSITSVASDHGIIYFRTEPGHLTIQLDDPSHNYTNNNESDNFEPDTLDRKPSKLKINENQNRFIISGDTFNDSLERPQILLKSTGSFKNDISGNTNEVNNSSDLPNPFFQKGFGSLRAIFEAKNKCPHKRSLSPGGSTKSLDVETEFYSKLILKKNKSKIIRPDARHVRRQRQPSPTNINDKLKPPNSLLSDKILNKIKEDIKQSSRPPLPPRSIKPPLPPKNGVLKKAVQVNDNNYVKQEFSDDNSISSSDYEPVNSDISLLKKGTFLKPETSFSNQSCSVNNNNSGKSNVIRTEDSGYLSSDSNDSDQKSKKTDTLSDETDESFFDGTSESGAESIATDSFSFGKPGKFSLPRQHDKYLFNDGNISFVKIQSP